MEDRELENLIKQSADNLEVKDFSARLPDIQRIADNTAVSEREAIFAKQPVTQTVGGRSAVKRNVIIIVAVVFVFAAVFLSAIFAIAFMPTNSAMDGADFTGAVNEGATGTESDASVNSVTSEAFYSYFENAVDFSPYDAVYYICDDEAYAGKAGFVYGSNYVTVYIYYTVDYNGGEGYERDGLTYVFEGLSEEELLTLTESLFGVAEEQ